MYRIDVIIGLKPNKKGVDLVGGIVTSRVLDEKFTELLGAKNVESAGINLQKTNMETVPSASVSFNGVGVERIFKELRKIFTSPLVNSDAGVGVAIGDMSNDYINDYLDRSTYLNTLDSTLIVEYTDKINKLVRALRLAN